MKNLKERIVDTAIDLFNRDGVGRITTNHIIDAMDISPGTLYYHFRNKEDIIRSVFRRITVEFDAIFSSSGPGYTADEAAQMVRQVYTLYYRYRFFYLDITAIIRKDEKLRKDYIRNYREKMKKYRELFIRFVEQGMFKPFSSDEEMDCLLRSLWIINDFWLSYCHAVYETVPDNIVDEGVKHYFYLLRPYLSAEISASLPLQAGE